MISSMTAFARTERQGEWGSLVCEMRSINHRYLEISLHLPDILRVLEMPIRECIREHVKRGKIECGIRLHSSQTEVSAMFTINATLAKELCSAGETIAAMLREPQKINPTDIMRFPGVMETKEASIEVLQPDVLRLVEQTLVELIEVRQREGEELKRLFLQRLDAMQVELTKVRERLPHVMKEQHDRLLKRFQDAKIELDPNRLEQEMVMFAQKIDVAEEIERTETHISEVRRMLKHGGIIGRRFDFLLQELNREANTLGSKSVDPVITHAAVEMKVLIEQIREQVQNIE
jgi:uncharacterized protein (TIGR00255 family)